MIKTILFDPREAGIWEKFNRRISTSEWINWTQRLCSLVILIPPIGRYTDENDYRSDIVDSAKDFKNKFISNSDMLICNVDMFVKYIECRTIHLDVTGGDAQAPVKFDVGSDCEVLFDLFGFSSYSSASVTEFIYSSIENSMKIYKHIDIVDGYIFYKKQREALDKFAKLCAKMDVLEINIYGFHVRGEEKPDYRELIKKLSSSFSGKDCSIKFYVFSDYIEIHDRAIYMRTAENNDRSLCFFLGRGIRAFDDNIGYTSFSLVKPDEFNKIRAQIKKYNKENRKHEVYEEVRPK